MKPTFQDVLDWIDDRAASGEDDDVKALMDATGAALSEMNTPEIVAALAQNHNSSEMLDIAAKIQEYANDMGEDS